MFRSSMKLLMVGAVILATLSLVAPQADAQWGCCYRPVTWGCCAPRVSCYSCYTPCCYTPCWTSCYSPCYDSCGLYLGCRPGPVRRLLLGSYRWYWGGCYSGCYSGCATYTTGCCGDVPSAVPNANHQPTPAKKPVESTPPEAPAPANPAPVNPAPTPMPETDPSKALPPASTKAAENSGVLTVWVPYDAKVTINGLETKNVGSRREFVSYGLKPGFSYKYVVKVQVDREGQTLEDTQTVILTAGQIKAVAFGFNANPAEQVATR
jgi:uncharacterized protein (TIGR03000 family)